MVMTRYEFLAELHTRLQPRGYLEIGVQTGASLVLASCPAIGIDPHPVVNVPLPATTQVITSTSDDYFDACAESGEFDEWIVDLAFIDGMHLAEFALRDFINVARYASDRAVVVFDDVLPYNAEIAVREEILGDWTGDVWRVVEALWPCGMIGCLELTLVDSWPTGLLVVTNIKSGWADLAGQAHGHNAYVSVENADPPSYIINRTTALQPEAALEKIMRGRT